MTNRDIVIALISSVVSGVAVWLISQAYNDWRERRREKASKTIKSLNDDKTVSDDIFWTLGPGRSVALMKQMLGVQDIFRRADNPIFSDQQVTTHSYFYMFKNAHVKITSRDNESIDSITVIPMDESLSADTLLIPEEVRPTKFGQLKVWPELAASPYHHMYISTIKDSSFALEETIGPPTNLHYTFFGYSDRSNEYEESGDPKVFVGSVINGVCVSASSEDIYYIYDYEYHSTTTSGL